MQGLDAHYSALWVANERRIAKQGKTEKYTIRIAVEGFVEIDVDATSRSDAVEQAMEKFNEANLGIAITDKSIEDVEKWK
jgi:hypothetical protein